MPPTLFDTHGCATRAVTLTKRAPDPASVEKPRRPLKEIVVVGKDAHRRVVDVLKKAFPQKSKETRMPTLSEQCERLEKKIEKLEKQLSADDLDDLEATIESLGKASKSVAHLGNPVKGPPPPPDPFANLARENDGDGADSEDANTDNARKAGGRHRFEAMVDFIRSRDGSTRAAAMTKARKEYPELFASYQISGLAKSYAALVEDEIRKGCSAEVAAQRVAYAHPDLARQSIAKRSASVSEFMSVVDDIKKARGCSRTAAMSAARRDRPDLFGRFENV